MYDSDCTYHTYLDMYRSLYSYIIYMYYMCVCIYLYYIYLDDVSVIYINIIIVFYYFWAMNEYRLPWSPHSLWRFSHFYQWQDGGSPAMPSESDGVEEVG